MARLPQWRARAWKNPKLRSNCGTRRRRAAQLQENWRRYGARVRRRCRSVGVALKAIRSPGLGTGASPFTTGTPTDFPADQPVAPDPYVSG